MNPFIGQILMFGGNFAPRGWAFCDGQLLSISANSALFAILGTTYGGDGRTTFGLPDLRGRVSMHPGHGPGLSSYNLGQKGGTETNVLQPNQVPNIKASSANATQTAATAGSSIATPGTTSGRTFTATEGFNTSSPNVNLNSGGGSTPVNNIQPYLCVNYIIALQGVFPSRS